MVVVFVKDAKRNTKIPVSLLFPKYLRSITSAVIQLVAIMQRIKGLFTLVSINIKAELLGKNKIASLISTLFSWAILVNSKLCKIVLKFLEYGSNKNKNFTCR